jgi:F-type H+-transporting ATPase subunit b
MPTFASAVLSGSIIDLDGSFFVQLVVFFVGFFILRSLVFKPMMALFDAREAAIDGARAEAKKLEKTAGSKAGEYDAAMQKIRVEAGAERDRLRKDGQHLEKAILEKVQKDTQAHLASQTAKIEAEGAALRAEIAATVPALARDMASRLLGREVK